jgi:hypothetical protein
VCKLGSFNICGTNVRFFAGVPSGEAPIGTLGFDVGANNAPYVFGATGWMALGGGGTGGGGVVTNEPNVLFFAGAPTGSAAKGTIAFDTTTGFTPYVFNDGWQKITVANGGSFLTQSVCGPNVIFFPGAPPPPPPPAGGGPGTPPNGTIGLPSGGGVYVFYQGSWHLVNLAPASIPRLIYANFLTAEYFAQGAVRTFADSVKTMPPFAALPLPVIDGDGLLVEDLYDGVNTSAPELQNEMLANFQSLIADTAGFTLVFEWRPSIPAFLGAGYIQFFDTPGPGAWGVDYDSSVFPTQAFVFSGIGPNSPAQDAGPNATRQQMCIGYYPQTGTMAISVNGQAPVVGAFSPQSIAALRVIFIESFFPGVVFSHIQLFAAYDATVPLSKFAGLSTIDAIPPIAIPLP